MVRYLCLMMLLVPLALFAQSEPELIELDLQNQQESAWEELYQHLMEPSTHFGIDNWLWLDDKGMSLHQVRYQAQGHEFVFNNRNDWDAKTNPANFRAAINSDKLVKELNIGHYRINFGSGTGMGSGSKSAKQSLISLHRPPQPQIYSPFGAAARLGVEDFGALVFASINKRDAQLSSQGKIQSLPRSRAYLPGSTKESIWGAAASYQVQLFRLGLMVCRQSYDKAFASPTLKQHSTLVNLAGGVNFKEHSLELESGLLNKKEFHYLAWSYRHQGFEQKLSLAKDPDQRQLAYSSPKELLSRDANTFELAWDAHYPLFKDAGIISRFAINQNFDGQINSQGLRSRVLASFYYKPKGKVFDVRVSRFDKEILAYSSDLDYSVTRPTHWRFELGYKDMVLPQLQLVLNSRYHFENKEAWRDNAFYYHSGVVFELKNLRLGAGYQGWQSAKTGIYYEDDTPLAWSLSKKNDQKVYLNTYLTLKYVKLGLKLSQSLKNIQDRELVLRIGTWI